MNGRASYNKKNNDGRAVGALLLVVVVLVHLAVPCAGQCATSELVASVSSTGVTDVVPTIAQRILISDSPVIIATAFLTVTFGGVGTVQMQIHHDNSVAGAPGALVSAQYVSQLVTTGSGTAAISFSFSNGPALVANTHYWIVLTSPASLSIKWYSAVTQTSTQSIDLNAGVAAAANATGLVPPDQVQSYVWNTYPPGTVTLALTISGCVTTAAPSPEASSSPLQSLLPVSPTTISIPSISPISTATASAMGSPLTVPSTLPFPSSVTSFLPVPSLVPTPVPTLQSTRTPQASASATPVVLTPITTNVTSSFDTTQTALNLTAPASTNGTSGVTQPGVTVVSQFSEVRVGNRSLSPPAIQELTVSNDTSTNTTTYTYASQLENATSVEQAFTFFDRKTSANFSGLTFDIGASSVKWSIHLQATTTANSTTADGLTLRYRLTGLMMKSGNANTSSGSAGGAVASRGQVVVQRETPRANMTTYLVPLFDSTTTSTTTTTTRTTAAQVELFDVALIDGTHFVPISHSIVRTGDNERAEYVVELVLPGFNESLFYDPSIGLGVLLGRNGRDDGGGSDSNVGLIVGVAVAIPVAVALVLVVIGAALVIAWRKKRLTTRRTGSINFGTDDVNNHL